MSTYANERSFWSRLISWMVVAVVALAALKVAFWLIGMLMGIVGAAMSVGAWLLFTLGPVLLVGWVVLKLIRWLGKPADQGV